MLGEWCLVVRPSETASLDQGCRVATIVESGQLGITWERRGSDFLVRVADAESLAPTERKIRHALERHQLTEAVVWPLPMGRFDSALGDYLIVDVRDQIPVEPVIAADEIRWAVAVRPASAFDWRAARATLEKRGRLTISESADLIEVGARDERDASSLVAELTAIECIGDATARRLGWLRRWRVRQRLLGNYAGDRDLTQPT